jgi:hypothetical protein
LTDKNPENGIATEAVEITVEATVSRLQFVKFYFQSGVKFLLNWKYGIRLFKKTTETSFEIVILE